VPSINSLSGNFSEKAVDENQCLFDRGLLPPRIKRVVLFHRDRRIARQLGSVEKRKPADLSIRGLNPIQGELEETSSL
jgi:hypothetical protein